MTDEDIKRCTKILVESGVEVDIESERSPYIYYMSILFIGERNIKRMVDYFEQNLQANIEVLYDLSTHGILNGYSEIYTMIRRTYLDKFEDDIKIQNREDNINDVLD